MNGFDERQLQIRGLVFKHTVEIFFIVMAADMMYSLITEGLHLFGAVSNAVILMIVFMGSTIEMIYRRVYINEWKYRNKIALILGACSLFALIVNRYRTYLDQILFMVNGQISTEFGLIVMNLCCIVIAAYNFISLSKERKEMEELENEK